MKFVRFKIVLPIITFMVLLSGCSDRYETIQPPGASVAEPAVVNSVTVAINVDKTKALFKRVTIKELGDKVGLVEMRSEGILIHPGETHPTKVSFKLSRTYHKILIRPFIAVLPADATKIKEAGTVGLEFWLDGKSEGRVVVNRDTMLIKELNLANVDTLTVVVDNEDGKPWFDWLMLGVVDTK
jgi:hypothetical protein